MPGGLAVCAIFKNEAPFLREWVAYHQLVGFTDFYLFDNDSTDGGAQELDDLVQKSNVRVIKWPFRPGQAAAYQYFIENFAKNHAWVAFLDIDEFVHPLDADNVGDLLKRADQFSGMLIHWLNFGSSGHESRPVGLVLENYHERLPDSAATHRHVKSFARGASLIAEAGVHVMRISGPVCNARGEAIENIAIQEKAYLSGMVINHYYTKSREDWKDKVNRGRATTEDPHVQKKLAWFDEQYTKVSQIEDRRIMRFLPSLRDALASGCHRGAG